MDEIEVALKGFGGRLKKMIDDLEVSPGAFAMRCEISDSLMRGYIAGTSHPGLEKLLVLAKKGGRSVEWLATGREGPSARDGSFSATEQGVAPWTDLSDFVRVPHYDVRASAGLGLEVGAETITHYNCYRRDWWQQHIGVDPEKCFSSDIGGDSMAPVLTDNTRPIWFRDSEVLNEAIYMFRIDESVFVKMLQRLPGRKLIAKSKNPQYDPFEIDESREDFLVIARAIFKETGEKL